MCELHITYGYSTHKGNREENQDASLILQSGSVWTFAMADGMGGYSFGKEAAEMALNAVKSELEALEQYNIEYIYFLLQRKYEQINSYIYNLSNTNSFKMGTTISMMNFIGNRFILSNAGDTRIYRIRDNGIRTLSKLHNVAAQEYEKGNITFEQYRVHRMRSVLTQCIGLESEIHPFFTVDNAKQGDIYIICTDGVHNFIDEYYLVDLFSFNESTRKKCMDDLCCLAVKEALYKGSEDNLSIIAIKIS